MSTYMISKADEEIRGKSFVYAVMKKIVGENECEAAVSKVIFTKDKKVGSTLTSTPVYRCCSVYVSFQGLVFDISSEYDELIEKKWFNSNSLELKKLTELPELDEEVF